MYISAHFSLCFIAVAHNSKCYKNISAEKCVHACQVYSFIKNIFLEYRTVIVCIWVHVCEIEYVMWISYIRYAG